MFPALRASTKFHALYTKSALLERLGRKRESEQAMDAARQRIKEYTNVFASETAAR